MKKKKKKGHKIEDEKEKKVWKASPCWTVTPALRGPRPKPACIYGMVMDGWMDGRTDGQAKSKKIMYF